MRFGRMTLVIGGLVCLFVTGCGGAPAGPKWPDPVKVGGKVTYQGKPFANGTVMFIPDESTIGQGGTGQTNDAGEYSVQTRWHDQKMKDGLIPGKYKVAFSRFKKPDGSVWIPAPNATEGPASSGAREEMPIHLSAPSESKFIVDVKDGAKQDFDLQ